MYTKIKNGGVEEWVVLVAGIQCKRLGMICGCCIDKQLGLKKKLFIHQ